jgi:hypothetical protein
LRIGIKLIASTSLQDRSAEVFDQPQLLSLHSLLPIQARSLLTLFYVIESIGTGLISKTWFILKMAFRLIDSNVAFVRCDYF